MKGTPAVYLGRIVEKKHFRTFVFGTNGEKKLVESWDAFEAAMQSGIWFATQEDANAIVNENPTPKPKRKSKSKSKTENVTDNSDDALSDDELVF